MTFEDFWLIYPRREGRKKAQIAFKKVKMTKEIEEKIRLQIPHRYIDREKQYIPLPTTYINGELWEDELTNVSFINKHTDRGWRDKM